MIHCSNALSLSLEIDAAATCWQNKQILVICLTPPGAKRRELLYVVKVAQNLTLHWISVSSLLYAYAYWVHLITDKSHDLFTYLYKVIFISICIEGFDFSSYFYCTIFNRQWDLFK